MLKPNRDRLIKLAVVGCIILLVGLAGYQAWSTVQLALNLRTTASQLESLAARGIENLDPEQLISLVAQARMEAEQLDARLRPLTWITDNLRWLPKVGPTIAAAGPLSEYAVGITTAADELLRGFRPLLEDDSTANEGGLSISERMLVALEDSHANLANAQTALAQACAARSEFQLGDLPQSLQEPLARVDRFLPLAQQGLEVLQMLPMMLGAEEPQAYLLVAQNRDELRASGGFISAVGTIVLDRGQIASLSIGDSYAVDDFSKVYPSAPYPIERYMLAQQWLVRDANWSPDFPTTATNILDLYQLSTDTNVDGVIAFDQDALARVLAITGPLTVEGSPEAIGSTNVEQFMHASWAPEPGEGISLEWWEHRKDFIRDLGEALIARIQQSADRTTFVSLAKVTVDLLHEKHLLVFMKEATLTEAMAELGWDNALHPGPGDFLMVVDSNVGFNKVDPLVERSIHYQIDLSDMAQPVGSVSIGYVNTVGEIVPCVHEPSYGEGTYADMQARCYWDYVRVYVPDGSVFIEGQLPPTPGEWLLTAQDESGEWSIGEGEAGTVVFGGIFVVPTLEHGDLTLTYFLPQHVIALGPEGELTYALRLVKQAGTDATAVSIHLIPPPGYEAANDNRWEPALDGSLHWTGDLQTDIDLTLTLNPATH